MVHNSTPPVNNRKPRKWLDSFIWGPSYLCYSIGLPIFLSIKYKKGFASYGLVFGLLSVLTGQVTTTIFHILYNEVPINKELGVVVNKHFSQLEGILLLGGYLSTYWISGTMPLNYYQYDGGIIWSHVWYQLLIQDALQYTVHRIQHHVPILYKYSHAFHHKHIHPTLFDSFDGSILDTTCMILIPLWLTSRIINTNVWSYMVFGTIYSNTLSLIHSQREHPWDMYFRLFGIGTQYDHHIHHQKFKCNYGHIFMYWDWMCNTIYSED